MRERKKVPVMVYVEEAVCFGCGKKQIPEIMSAQAAGMSGITDLDADALVAQSTRLKDWSYGTEIDGQDQMVKLCPDCRAVAARAALKALNGGA